MQIETETTLKKNPMFIYLAVLTICSTMGLQAWRTELNAATEAVGEVVPGGAGDSGVVLSPERYVPADGVLIQPGEKEAE